MLFLMKKQPAENAFCSGDSWYCRKQFQVCKLAWCQVVEGFELYSGPRFLYMVSKISLKEVLGVKGGRWCQTRPCLNCFEHYKLKTWRMDAPTGLKVWSLYGWKLQAWTILNFKGRLAGALIQHDSAVLGLAWVFWKRWGPILGSFSSR